MIDWMLDTLIWTGALIALVLLVRRPVATHFGAQAAYALWLIPFARLFVPPIELPAMFAPEMAASPTIAIDPVVLMALQAQGAQPVPVEADNGWLWLALGIGIWLTGAAVMLAWRFAAYFRMRGQLLAEGQEKLVIGNVRVIETPATESPLAFGVLDKVIAVPAGFLAETDTQTRNLAIAHELAHHDRGDLIANFAAQPLFALHWFNPLGLLGWRALRRDQEAACDARVVATSDDETRAAYAQTIARFSAGPDLGLAAPMACPVLGEKSIIQRLRSLTMADISPRRRIAGRAALVAGLLALPLTASFTYAAPSFASQADDAGEERPEVAIRDIDPDIDPITEKEADRIAEEAEEIAREAAEIRREFSEEGRAFDEAEIEKRAARIEKATARLTEREKRAWEVRFEEKMAAQAQAEAERAEALAVRMARVKARTSGPEWEARSKQIEEMALSIDGIDLSGIALEVVRELDKNGVPGSCKVNGKAMACHEIDVAKLQRDAFAEARKAIKTDKSLTADERKRALEALDSAMARD